MLYWVTQTITSSARLYWENQHSRRARRSTSGCRPASRAIPKEIAALPAPVGRAALQRDALGRHAARRPLRRDGAARAVRRRRPRPSSARVSLTVAAASRIRVRLRGTNVREPVRGVSDGAVGRQGRGHHRRGSGMAKASVKIFVREGAKVVAADISGAEKDTAAEVGAGVLPVHCDVTQEADVEAMMQRRGRRVRSPRRGAATSPASPTRAMLADVTMEHYDQHDGRRPARRAPRHEARDPGDARGRQRRRDRQLVVDRRAQRVAVHERVLGGQGRRDLAHQGGRGRVRRQRHPRQRDLPRLHLHRDHGRGRARTSPACSRRPR